MKYKNNSCHDADREVSCPNRVDVMHTNFWTTIRKYSNRFIQFANVNVEH